MNRLAKQSGLTWWQNKAGAPWQRGVAWLCGVNRTRAGHAVRVSVTHSVCVRPATRIIPQCGYISRR